MRLSPFEHYMLADDRDSHPMCFYLKCQFSGRFDRQIWQQAANRALQHHPLLRAHVVGSTTAATRSLSWVESHNPKVAIHWDHIGSGARIDLSYENGVRFFIKEDGSRSELLAQFHHACTDGKGALRFLEHCLSLYRTGIKSQAATTKPPRDLAFTASKLHHRLHFHVSALGFFRRSLYDLERIALFLSKRGRSLLVPESPSAPLNADKSLRQMQTPSFIEHEMTIESSRQLVQTAKTRSVSVNDLMMRDLFLTLRDWNKTAKAINKRAIRIAVAIDLRKEQDVDMPAANMSSLFFVDRTPGQIKNEDNLLKGIHREITRVKTKGQGLALISVLRSLGSVPGPMKWILREGACFSTSVLSNLGVAYAQSELRGLDGKLKAGNLTLDSIQLITTRRPNVHAVFAVTTYAGQTRITLHYDRASLNVLQAKHLLAMYSKRLESHCPLVATPSQQSLQTARA